VLYICIWHGLKAHEGGGRDHTATRREQIDNVILQHGTV
jgi:hypothetical protein